MEPDVSFRRTQETPVPTLRCICSYKKKAALVALRNTVLRWKLLVCHLTPKQDNRPFSAVRDLLFNTVAARLLNLEVALGHGDRDLHNMERNSA
jgi:hypothetical protein